MSTLPRVYRIASLLIDLEAALRVAGLWGRQEPAAQALASAEPFCVDTLEFPQWLQFVFLPRMSALISEGLPLPERSGIAEMAEMWLRGVRSPYGPSLLAVLREIDTAISSPEA